MVHLIIHTLMLVAVNTRLVFCSAHRKAVRDGPGDPDTNEDYKFVLPFVDTDLDMRRPCTGTFLSQEWVLAAAGCIISGVNQLHITHVQYDDFSKSPKFTNSKLEIFEKIKHPGFQFKGGIDDIAMLRVSPFNLTIVGKISNVDYKSLTGYPVEYVGFNETAPVKIDKNQLRRVGKGVAVSCSDLQINQYLPGLFVCVASKCSDNGAFPGFGDAGAPLFFNNKVVGVFNRLIGQIGLYTAISPYVTWIGDVIKD